MKKLEKFIARTVAGNRIMMPVGKTATKFSGLIMANDVAAYIWENIEKVSSDEELVDLICDEFEVDRETAMADTTELLNQMEAAGWIARD